MLSRDWQARVVIGAVLLLLAISLALAYALQQRRRSQPPVRLSVDVAVTRVLAGETLDSVRLTDLIVLCRPPLVHARQHYGIAVGPSRDHGPTILFEIADDEECTDDSEGPPGSAEIVGSLVAAARTGLDMDALDHPHAILRPHKGDPRAPLEILASLVLGAYLLHRGLRLRRELREPDPPSVA